MTIKDVPLTAEALDALAAEDVQLWADVDIQLRGAWWLRRKRNRLKDRVALAEAACHADGHLREAAVEKLATSTNPEALPLLLIRCVDWVVQVRDAARAAVVSKLDEPSLRAMLPLIGMLSRRGVDTWMTDLFRRAILTDSLFEAALTLNDRETRRWVHDEAIRTGRFTPARLARIALRDNDLAVRAKCGLAVLDNGDADAMREVAVGGTAVVRARALTLPGADVSGSLTERTSLVRSMAQALVLKAGGDPAARYRTLLADGVVTPATVAGLGETGDRSDVDLLLSHLTAERPRVRGAAVRALRRITPDNLREVVLPSLTDPSPFVVRQAVMLLHGVITKADEGFLFSLLATENPAHVRRGALALLRGHDSWTRLLVDLRLGSASDELAEDARLDLVRWVHESARLYTRPTADAAAEILDLLGDAPAPAIRFLLKDS